MPATATDHPGWRERATQMIIIKPASGGRCQSLSGAIYSGNGRRWLDRLFRSLLRLNGRRSGRDGDGAGMLSTQKAAYGPVRRRSRRTTTHAPKAASGNHGSAYATQPIMSPNDSMAVCANRSSAARIGDRSTGPACWINPL